SDFVVRPVLRIRGPGFATGHMVVHVGNGLAGGLREEARHNSVDKAGNARTHEAGADRNRTDAVRSPGHAQRPGMLEEQAISHAGPIRFPPLRRHAQSPRRCLATPTGFEPVAYRLGICRSILLSYGVVEPPNRSSGRRNQFTWLGRVTGSRRGATGIPSSTSDFACSSVVLPWTCSRSISPACIARAVSVKRSP